MSLQLFKQSSPPSQDLLDEIRQMLDDLLFGRIRCPLCGWRPSSSSMWACQSFGTPEPFFGGCGSIWNTFETRGLCPGCAHQWRWTSCHRCHRWSPHEEWYEKQG